MNTPWGQSQEQRTIADGIVQVSTAGHGGIHLSPERNALVHEAWRTDNGWYEEDCEAHIVAVTFPAEFAPHYPNWTEAQDHEAARNWFPDQYEIVFGVTLNPGDSFMRDEQTFYAAHAGDWLVTTAWGDWHDGVPDGMVGVHARVGGRPNPHGMTGYFLIPADEYATRAGHAFIVDPARHEQVADFTRTQADTKQVA